jgi:hypothetical protein
MCNEERSKDALYLILTCLFTSIVGVFSTWLVWHNQNTTDRLEDLFFMILPNWSEITYPIPNYISIAIYIAGFISFEFKDSFKFLAQFIFLQCVLTSLRAVTVSLTFLPNIYVYEYCKDRPSDFFSVLWYMMRYGTCADYLYSGHTASGFLMYMFVHRHGRNYFFEILTGLLLGFLLIFLLLMRWHYSVDIALAIIIVWLLFKYYKDHENELKDTWWIYFSSFTIPRTKRTIYDSS